MMVSEPPHLRCSSAAVLLGCVAVPVVDAPPRVAAEVGPLLFLVPLLLLIPLTLLLFLQF